MPLYPIEKKFENVAQPIAIHTLDSESEEPMIMPKKKKRKVVYSFGQSQTQSRMRVTYDSTNERSVEESD